MQLQNVDILNSRFKIFQHGNPTVSSLFSILFQILIHCNTSTFKTTYRIHNQETHMLEIIADFNYLVAQAQSVPSVHEKYYCFQYLHYFFYGLVIYTIKALEFCVKFACRILLSKVTGVGITSEFGDRIQVPTKIGQ